MQFIPTQRTRKKQHSLPADPKSLERQVRQILADKISGNQIGIWLLLPEHLRLGTWDLLCSWTALPPQRVEPRLALHLVNEAAMCLCALGKLRRASHHFGGSLLALDPHRMLSYSQRQMRRHRFSSQEKPAKMAQTFFLLDCHTGQPLCFTLSSAAQSVSQATPELLRLAAQILGVAPGGKDKPLILADKEHYAQELFTKVHQDQWFNLLCAEPAFPQSVGRWRKVPPSAFTEHWPGYATSVQPYHFTLQPKPTYYEYVQRSGGRLEDIHYQGFLSTARLAEIPALTSLNSTRPWAGTAPALLT